MWIKEIPNIFLINRTDRPERLDKSRKELGKFGIPFKVVPAIITEDGAWGLKLTMKALFEHCINMGYEKIVVFEDDVLLTHENTNELIEKCLEQVPQSFHCLQLGCILLMCPERVSENILKVNASYSTHAVIYSKEAMELIVPFLTLPEPLDVIIQQKLQSQFKCYTTKPQIAIQRADKSDIFKYDVVKNIGIDRFYKDGVIDWGKFSTEQFELQTKNI